MITYPQLQLNSEGLRRGGKEGTGVEHINFGILDYLITVGT